MFVKDQIRGCLYGTALGDALGAPFEGGPLERVTWGMLGILGRPKYRYSDDTQMTMDLVESIVRCEAVVPDDLARTFARNYTWTRGYGPGAAKILKQIRRGTDWEQASRSVYADGSFGNGAAMRASILGLIYEGSELEAAVQAASRITHAHPVGIDGARVMAGVASAAAAGQDPASWLEVAAEAAHTTEVRTRCQKARQVDVLSEEVARQLGNGVIVPDSVPTAVLVASKMIACDVMDLVDFCRDMGGDVDTIAAMAGTLYGTFHGTGALPQRLLDKVEGIDRLTTLSDALHTLANQS